LFRVLLDFDVIDELVIRFIISCGKDGNIMGHCISYL